MPETEYRPSEIYRRQSKYYNPLLHNRHVTVVGCGSLGGTIALALAKMGLAFFKLYDHDTVERHNIPNQPFDMRDIGMPKSNIIGGRINNQFETGICEVTMLRKWEKTMDIDTGIVVNAPDSILVRKQVFENTPHSSFIIDVRSGPESYNVYFCDTSNARSVNFYSKTFFEESEAVNNGCGAQSTIFGTLDVAALAVNGYMRWVNKERVPCQVTADLMSLEREQTYLDGL